MGGGEKQQGTLHMPAPPSHACCSLLGGEGEKTPPRSMLHLAAPMSHEIWSEGLGEADASEGYSNYWEAAAGGSDL